MNQAVIEQTLLGPIAGKERFQVERKILAEIVSLMESLLGDKGCYPINVKVRHLHSPSPPRASNGARQDTRSHLQLKADEVSEAAKEQGNGIAEAIESIKSKYLLACNRAHSWTRRQLGLVTEGEQSDYVWGITKHTAHRLS